MSTSFPSNFRGVAYLRDNNSLLPGTAVAFRTKSKDSKSEIEVLLILPIDPKKGIVSSWENVKQFYGETAWFFLRPPLPPHHWKRIFSH